MLYKASHILLAIIFHTAATYCQALTPLHFESLTINNGLSQGSVNSIIQDKKGFMWFATSDGLNKYDGYKFTVYHHKSSDSTSMADDDVASVFEDSQERLWVCTRTNGIDLFDRENLRFFHIKKETVKGLSSNNIYSIFEDRSGVFWIRSAKGLDKMIIKNSGTNLSAKDVQINHLDLDSIFGQSKTNIPSPKFFEDSRGNQFVYNGCSLYRLYVDSHTQHYSFQLYFAYTTRFYSEVGNLLEDTVSHTLFLNTWKGIFVFSNNTFPVPRLIYTHRVTFHDSWGRDGSGTIWLPQEFYITRISMATLSATDMIEDNNELANIRKFITSFYQDRQGVIWMGSAGYGIIKYDPGKEHFHTILTHENVYRMLQFKNDQKVLLLKDWNGIIINKDGGIKEEAIFDQQVFKQQGIRRPGPDYTAIDSYGNYWACLSYQLVKYDVANRRIKVLTFPFMNSNSPMSSPFADSKNNVWLCTGNYLVKVNVATDEFTKYNLPVLPLFKDFMQNFYEDKDGLIWLATIQGLHCFNPQTAAWKSWVCRNGDSTSLSNNYILSLCDDPLQPSKYLWVGSKGGGLNKLDKTTGKLSCITTAEGLPNNVIYGILPDHENNLWMSTNKGLCCYNPTTHSTISFTESDGLQGDEFNRYAYLKRKDGTLFFGGLKGITYFNPSDIKTISPPNVVLTDFRLFNKTIDFKQPNSPLAKNINFVNDISLNHRQNMFTIQFAAMDYRKTGNINYRYRLEGFDGNWIYTETAHEATYTNLDPGTYRFTVQGSNSAGVWGSDVTTLTIHIIPPWWRTWWFYLLAFVTVAFIVNMVHKYRLNQLLKLERIRNRIARDLHDEIGSSLSTISIYSKVVEQQMNKDAGITHPLLAKINENAKEVQEAMNDIVWSINTRNDNFENIINRMREHAIELLEAKDYSLHFSFDDSLRNVKLDMEQRKDFYLIYKEALNNAAKYADGTNVWISLSANHNMMSLTIRDDGKGFDTTLSGKNRNGLSNMQSRAKALKGTIEYISAIGEGTMVKLDFPK